MTAEPPNSITLFDNPQNKSQRNNTPTTHLIFSQDDIFNIKTYAADALRLPTTLPAVYARLGFERSNISGLEPEDLLTLYNVIRVHAISWPPIEEQIGQAARGLNSFSENLIRLGDWIITGIDALTLDEQMNTSVSAANLGPVEPAVAEPLPPGSKVLLIKLSDYLDDLGNDIRHYDRTASVLTESIHTFALSLQTELSPAVQQKIRLIKKNDIAQKIEALEYAIENSRRDIEQLEKNRPPRKQRRHGGDLSYMRVLRRWREHLNILNQQKDVTIKELQAAESLLRALAILQNRLVNTAPRMSMIHNSVSILQEQWRALAHSISQSASELKKITHTQDLFDFAYYFSSIVNPWRRVNQPTTVTEHLSAST